jgi:putative glutamine amidotransferase
MIGEVLGGDVSSANPRFEKRTVEHNQKENGEVPTHNIKIKHGTLLGRMMGVNSIMVNSLHRQRLLSVPKGFSVSAVAGDNAIEAIESKDGLVIGVQFHPEKLLEQDDAFIRIFRHLVRACNKKRSAWF